MLGVLALDGALSAIAGALFLPLYLGPVPFPISALLSGLVNAALVWAGLQWTPRPRLAALPMWAWLTTVVLLLLGGPGDDVVFGGAGIMQASPLIFLLLGATPPGVVLWRHAQRRAALPD
jgi:peptidoglycan biosynthesis protein MviN/MurJ (putative lipid II flippase)